MSNIRAKYNATPPTVADTQWTDLQVDTAGNLKVTAAVGATGLGKVEDTAHASGDTGIAIFGVRNDSRSIFGSDGDYSPLSVDGSGRLLVTMDSGTQVLHKSEDAVHGSGDTGIMALAVANTGAASRAANGDYTPIAVSTDGGVYPGVHSVTRVTADGQIKASAGAIHTISIAPTVAVPTAGLITVYDSLTETGTIIYSEWIFATTPGHTITLDVACGTGIYVGYDATLANVSCTVAYR